MYVMKKITTAFRGAARERGERIVDTNAIRIFEQEIYDCEHSMGQAKHDLAKIMAEKIRLERTHCQRINAIEKRELQAGEALDKGMEELASEIACWIAEQEAVIKDEQAAITRLADHEAKLRKTLNAAVKHIAHYRRELRLVQATQSSQKAAASLSIKANNLGSRITDMQESLERIRDRQNQFEDMQEALTNIENNLDNGNLDEKLRNAGIGGLTQAEAVLDRIRAKKH